MCVWTELRADDQGSLACGLGSSPRTAQCGAASWRVMISRDSDRARSGVNADQPLSLEYLRKVQGGPMFTTYAECFEQICARSRLLELKDEP